MPTDYNATKRTLIVARMDQGDAAAVAQIFEESDAGELPHALGACRRDLFHFHGLYFHLVESRHDIDAALSSIRSEPLFADVNSKLAKYVSAFDPSTWRGPQDAIAQPFYSWVADVPGPPSG